MIVVPHPVPAVNKIGTFIIKTYIQEFTAPSGAAAEGRLWNMPFSHWPAAMRTCWRVEILGHLLLHSIKPETIKHVRTSDGGSGRRGSLRCGYMPTTFSIFTKRITGRLIISHLSFSASYLELTNMLPHLFSSIFGKSAR